MVRCEAQAHVEWSGQLFCSLPADHEGEHQDWAAHLAWRSISDEL